MPQSAVDRWLPSCRITTRRHRQHTLERVPGLAAAILRARALAQQHRERTLVWLAGEIVWTEPWPPHDLPEGT